MSGQQLKINTDDARNLLRQLQQFQDTIGGDWKTVVNQWQNLRDCWRDRQYDQFEPFFEELCQTYSQSEQQCEDYIQLLDRIIRDTESRVESMGI